jgi:uncharacterized protein (TIGR03067 family)
MRPTLKTLGIATALGLALAAGVTAGGDDRSEAVKSDLARLQGTWINRLDGRTKIFHLSQDRFAEIFEFADGTTTTQGTITIDPTTNPKRMDFTFTEANGRGARLKGTTAFTIYQIDGDTFTFAAGPPGTRPERFPDNEGAGATFYLVFKRVKN